MFAKFDAQDLLTGIILISASAAGWAWIALRLARGKDLLRYEPRSRVPWTGLDVSVVISASILLLAVWQELVAAGEDRNSPDVQRSLFGAIALAEVVALGLAIALLVHRARATWIDLGFDTSRLAYDAVAGFVAFLASIAPVLLLQSLLTQHYESTHPLIELVKTDPTPRSLLLTTWIVVAVAPLFEEFLFRVVLQGWLEARERAWRRNRPALRRVRAGVLPIVCSSLAFALPHIQHGPDPIPLFLLALFLGYLYRQTHRIFPSLVLHMCFNAVTVVQLWIQFGHF